MENKLNKTKKKWKIFELYIKWTAKRFRIWFWHKSTERPKHYHLWSFTAMHTTL